MPGSLGELAAALRRAADDLALRGATECAKEAGQEYLQVLRGNTPVRSGELRASERVSSIRGSGTRAVATIGAYTIYARFREFGGTITAHDRSRGGWVGAPRIVGGHLQGHHTLHWGGEPGHFAMSVTQVGSFYFERTNREAGPRIAAGCQRAIQGILREAGL